jgi:hypothetical protein
MKVSDYTNLEAQFMPFPSIVIIAAQDSKYNSSPRLAEYYNFIQPVTDWSGPMFSDSLKLLPGRSGECFDFLYNDVFNAMKSSPLSVVNACTSRFLIPEALCKGAISEANNNFHNCLGGVYVHYQHPTPQCSAADWAMFDGVFQAYGPVAVCSSLTGLELIRCVSQNSGLPIGTSSNGCLACWGDLGDAIGKSAAAAACQSTPFGPDCLNNIDARLMGLEQLADLGMYTPLSEFQICAGRPLNLDDPRCSEEEVAAIMGLKLTMSDFMGVVDSVTGVDEAQLAAAALNQLPEIALLSKCGNAFKALVVQLGRHSAILSQTCVGEVPSELCLEDLNNLGIIQTFNTASGLDFVTLVVPPTTTTTVEETTTEETTTITTEVSGVSGALSSATVGLIIASVLIRF